MAVATDLTLVANPGSASRKYALFAGTRERASLHFEHSQNKLVCTIQQGDDRQEVSIDVRNLTDAAGHVVAILKSQQVLKDDDHIGRIALRVVAPGSYFLEDRHMTDEAVEKLHGLEKRAPLHISATLQELHSLRKQFKDTPIVGVSDSAFHITKPDYAWNYGLPLEDADRMDIKRFGYHGLSMASAVHNLVHAHKLPPKVIMCHIGSGVSITAIHSGKSVDTTMGYSPLEGVIMATRSGSIDATAVKALRDIMKLDEEGIEMYLNKHSGLLGLGGASDVRELLKREEQSDHRAHLALETYVYTIQKAIGQMTAAIGGIDLLGFTATVGERSAPIRKRILDRLHYLDLSIDDKANDKCSEPTELTRISKLAHSKPIFVIPADEATEMARRAQAI